MSENTTPLKELIRKEFQRLYAFGYFMSASREEATDHVKQLIRDARIEGESKILSAERPFDVLIGVMARRMEDMLGRRTDFTFEGLDETLRSDITRPIDVAGIGIANDPQRVHVMLWELKRTCLMASLCCLPPGVRVSFVLTDLMGYSPTDAATILNIKESAYRVRLTRARKRIEDYLTPRCTHVDRQNPCTCTGRLVIAIDANFVRPPANNLDVPHDPHDADGPKRDIGSLYRALPPVLLTPPEIDHVLAT